MMAFFISHANSSPLAYEQRADEVFATYKKRLNIANMSTKHLKIHSQRQTEEIHLLFSSVCFFFLPMLR